MRLPNHWYQSILTFKMSANEPQSIYSYLKSLNSYATIIEHFINIKDDLVITKKQTLKVAIYYIVFYVGGSKEQSVF